MLEKYVCPKCGKVAKTKQALERHAAYHEDDRPFSCEICHQRFKNSDDRGKHYRRLKKDGKFDIACQVCHKHFKSNDLLKKHVEILGCLAKSSSEDLEIKVKEVANVVLVDKFSALAKDVNNYSQDFQYSENSFESKNNVSDNTSNKTEVKCACKICQVPFSKVDDLKKHYHKIHNDTKRQVCIQCGQTLSSKDSLARHFSIFHQSDYPFQCDMCTQRFKIKEGLCRHVKFVHKDKGYPCEVCGRVFTQPVNLKKHMMLHNGAKEFKCSVCSREFRWKQALHKHMSTHKFINYVSSEVDDFLQVGGHLSNNHGDDFNDQNRATEEKSKLTASVDVNEKQDRSFFEYIANKTEDKLESDADDDIDMNENDELEAVYKKEEKNVENMEVDSETVNRESDRSRKRQWTQNGYGSINPKNNSESNINEHSSDMFLKVLEFAEIVTEFGSKDIDVERPVDGLGETDNEAECNIASDLSNGKEESYVKVSMIVTPTMIMRLVNQEIKKEVVEVDKVKEPADLKSRTNDLRLVDKGDEDAFENYKVGKWRHLVKDKDESSTTVISKKRMQTSKLNPDRLNNWDTCVNFVTDENDEMLILKGLTSGPTDNDIDAPRLMFRPSLIHMILESPKDVETASSQKPKTEINKPHSFEFLKSKTAAEPIFLKSDSKALKVNPLSVGTSLGKEQLNLSGTDENNALGKKFHIKVQQTSPQSSTSEKNISSPSVSDPESNRPAKDIGEILNLSKTPGAGKFSLVKHMLSLKNEENFDQAFFRNSLYSTPLDVNGFKNLVERHRISNEDGDRLYDLSAKQNIPFLWLGMTKSNGKMMDGNGSHDRTTQSLGHPDKTENQQLDSRPDQDENMEQLDTSSEINREKMNVSPPIKDCRNWGNKSVPFNDSGATTDAVMPPLNSCGAANVGDNDKVKVWLSKKHVFMEKSVNNKPTDQNKSYNFSYDHSRDYVGMETDSKSSSAVSAVRSKHIHYNAQNCDFIAENKELYSATIGSNISFPTNNHSQYSDINLHSARWSLNQGTKNDYYPESNISNTICETGVDFVDPRFAKRVSSQQFSEENHCVPDHNVNVSCSSSNSGTKFATNHHLVSHSSNANQDLLHRQNSYSYSSNHQATNAHSSGIFHSSDHSTNTPPFLMRSQFEINDRLLRNESNNQTHLAGINMLRPNGSCESLNSSLLINKSIWARCQYLAKNLLSDTFGETVNRKAHHMSHILQCLTSQNPDTSVNQGAFGTQNIDRNNSPLIGGVSILDLLDEYEKS